MRLRLVLDRKISRPRDRCTRERGRAGIIHARRPPSFCSDRFALRGDTRRSTVGWRRSKRLSTGAASVNWTASAYAACVCLESCNASPPSASVANQAASLEIMLPMRTRLSLCAHRTILSGACISRPSHQRLEQNLLFSPAPCYRTEEATRSRRTDTPDRSASPPGLLPEDRSNTTSQPLGNLLTRAHALELGGRLPPSFGPLSPILLVPFTRCNLHATHSELS